MEPSADGGAGEENDADHLRPNARTLMRALERGAEVHDGHRGKKECERGSLQAGLATGAREPDDSQAKKETVDRLSRGLGGARPFPWRNEPERDCDARGEHGCCKRLEDVGSVCSHPRSSMTQERRSGKGDEKPLQRRVEGFWRLEERGMPGLERFELRVGKATDGGEVAAELEDAIALRPGDENGAAHLRNEGAKIGFGRGEARPRLSEHWGDLPRGGDDARALGGRGPARKHDSIVKGEGRREPACAARALREEPREEPAHRPAQPIGPVDPAGIREHQAQDPLRMRDRKAQRRGPADGVAEEHCLVHPDGVEEPAQQFGIARRGRYHAVGTGISLTGPVERDDPEAVLKSLSNPGEVARAVADGMKAHQRGSAPVGIEGKAHAVDLDGSCRSADRRPVVHVICISYMFRPRTPPALVLRRRHARGRSSGTKSRERLVRAAAMEFNQVGYHGTNSNRLARRAGFAPAVFYQHFRDKRALFLAAYEAWVSAEWSALEVHAGRAADARSLACAIVAEVLAQHRRWRVFRASLRALVAADPVARRFYHRQRRRQLRWLASLRAAAGRAARSPEEDFLLLCCVERVCDAAADGELAALDLSAREVRRRLEDLVRAHLAETGA